MPDKETVLKVAKLARLELTEEEIELYTSQLTDILKFVEEISEVETEGVELFTLDLEETPMREDKVEESLPKEKLEINAPEFENGYFVVPRIFEIG